MPSTVNEGRVILNAFAARLHLNRVQNAAMSACIRFQDPVEINQPQVADLYRIGGSADPEAKEAKSQFEDRVRPFYQEPVVTAPE
jgi:hypothetical protein